jgi:hypothetical protein
LERTGLAAILPPGFASTYFGLDLFLDLPLAKLIIGILSIVALIVAIAQRLEPSDYVGRLVVTEKADGEGFIFSLELDEDPEDFTDKKSITFKVEK